MFLVVQVELFGQNPDVDYQLWLNYSVKIKTAHNLSYGGDVGIRGVWSNYDWNQILIRPTINYTFNKSLGASVAVAWFSTINQYTKNVAEFRIHQDVNAQWPNTKWFSLFWRLRFEQRFFFYQNEAMQNEFRGRLRFLGGIQTADLTWFGEKRPIYFQGSYEGFQTVGENNGYEFLINQSRIEGAFGQRLSSRWRYEIHVIVQRSRLLIDSGLQTGQLIFRVRVFHTIPFKKI